MALINCPECNHQVSDTASFCPNCGCAISKIGDMPRQKKTIMFFSSHPTALVLGVLILVILTILLKLDNSYLQKENGYKSSHYNSYSEENTTNAASIFKNLKMFNFKTTMGQHYGKMICECQNNNSFTVHGYFYVSFYDKAGNLMYCQLMSLPSVGSGETVICSALISKDDYPTGYSYVRYTQATLTKD